MSQAGEQTNRVHKHFSNMLENVKKASFIFNSFSSICQQQLKDNRNYLCTILVGEDANNICINVNVNEFHFSLFLSNLK